MAQRSEIERLREENEKLRAEMSRLSARLAEGAVPPACRWADELVCAFSDMLFLIGPDNICFDFRVADREALYVSPEAFLGAPIDEFLPDPVGRQLREAVALARSSGGPARFAYELPMPDGIRSYEARLEPLTGGAVASVVTDVTDRRRAEAELRESEHRYRVLFDSNPHPMWVYDTESLAFLAVNDAAIAHYGYTRDEFLARTIADIRPAEDVARLRKNVSRVTDGFDAAGVWRHRKKDGEIIDVEITSHTLQFEDRPAELVLALDVSERRRLEAQFLQAQKMEAVGRLAGGVAHDFNNLLTAIMASAEMGLRSAARGDSPQRFLEETLTAAERAASLTRQLLAFSRRQVLNPRAVDLNDVVEGVLKMLRRLLGEDVVIETSLAPDLRPVLADPGQLEQVLLNLALNSRDAMPGGGTLRLETENGSVGGRNRALSGAQERSRVMLLVADTGQGMTDEVKSHLFEPFYTTKEVGKGTGLGLSTVYGIIQQTGGSIDVTSEVGAGTVFRIYLPTVLPETAEAEVPTEWTAGGGSETILLAEDEEAVRTTVRNVLTGRGYTVWEAADGEAALDIARRRAPIDLLLTDLVMPGVGGRELAARLRHLQPGVRVLYMSGYLDDGSILGDLVVDRAQFLPKPFSPAELLRRVRLALRRVNPPRDRP